MHPILAQDLKALARDLRRSMYRHVVTEYPASGFRAGYAFGGMVLRFADTHRLAKWHGQFFNMNFSSAHTGCGTAFCVYGLLRERGTPLDLINPSFNHDDDSKLHDLFYPQGNVDYERVTARHAALAIDQLLAGHRPDYENMRGLKKQRSAMAEEQEVK